jgi:hypothetical protein
MAGFGWKADVDGNPRQAPAKSNAKKPQTKIAGSSDIIAANFLALV